MSSFGTLASGEVVVDRYNSHLREDAACFLPSALARINGQGRSFLAEEVDFGQPIGETMCVSTGPGDRIVYAKRPKRFGHTRFVVNRLPESCSSLVVILVAAKEAPGLYVLISAFIGRKAEPEPWDKNATAGSVAFWNTHALVWGHEETVPGTETVICPW